jgi:hypothetical protein
LATGSALTFDGSALVSGTSIRANSFMEIRSNTAIMYWENAANTLWWAQKLTGSDFAWDYYDGSTVAEKMRLTSTGLGIGTSSPATKVHAAIASATTYTTSSRGNVLTIQNTTAGGYAGIEFLTDPSSGNAGIGGINAFNTASGDSVLAFSTRGSATLAERARIDSAGNLGLGVTPSAWDSSVKALQVGSGAALHDAGSGNTILSSNLYYSSTGNRYIATDFATAYQQNNGLHYWYTAASGTAGNTISFTQALTLHASGGLSLGNTSDPGATNLSVSGTASAGIVHRGGSYTGGATTPSVTGITYMPISNSSATTITNFTGGVTGQILYLLFNDANTTINRSNARLAGSINFTSAQFATLALLFNGSEWIEVSRSVLNG